MPGLRGGRQGNLLREPAGGMGCPGQIMVPPCAGRVIFAPPTSAWPTRFRPPAKAGHSRLALNTTMPRSCPGPIQTSGHWIPGGRFSAVTRIGPDRPR